MKGKLRGRQAVSDLGKELEPLLWCEARHGDEDELAARRELLPVGIVTCGGAEERGVDAPTQIDQLVGLDAGIREVLADAPRGIEDGTHGGMREEVALGGTEDPDGPGV